ncbi:MAG: DUF881 domain-containing protein [Clostridia bacterium]|nr:DUF881 domain-containing protein [Clostridia bacterium]
MSNNNFKTLAFLSIMLALFGILVTVEFTGETDINHLSRQSTQDLVTMWRDLSTKKDELQEEILLLNQQKQQLARESHEGGNSSLDRLRTLQKINGSIEIKGPGVRITIPKEPPIFYLDLVDLMNELWASGAEAISINGHRITYDTCFFSIENDAGIFLTIKGIELEYPIVIKAIGDPITLERGLTFPGGIMDNLTTLYKINPKVETLDSMVLPSAR